MKESCVCDEHGKCGVCVMRELEPKTQRVIKKPNKSGKCNCLQDDKNGFRYTAYEMHNGEIIDVHYVKCDNCKLSLVDLNNVKPEKQDKLNIKERTCLEKYVWVEWCKEQCKTKII